MNRCAWAAMAAATCGWACPVDVTAMPPLKSRYRSPVVVVTHDPSPDATSRSVTLNQTFDRLFALIIPSFQADPPDRSGPTTRAMSERADDRAVGSSLATYEQRR